MSGINASLEAHDGVDHAVEDAVLAAAAMSADSVDINIQASPDAGSRLASAAAVQASNVAGSWGPVIDWPHVPVSIANLPDGRLLSWSSSEVDAFPSGNPEFTYATVWDPASGGFTDVSHSGHDMFCGRGCSFRI